VETVLQLVAEQGSEAVSAQLVADRIGVTQPAVFRHFPTKEAIWLAVMDWLEERLKEIFETAEPGGENAALVVLARMFRGHAKLIESHPALAKLVFSDHLRLEFPALHRRFGKLHQGYYARLVDLVERAKTNGEVATSVPAEDAATLFLATIQGLGFQFAIARQPMNLPRVADRTFALFVRGIGVDP
jgi:AcrR family transcriptional regulator